MEENRLSLLLQHLEETEGPDFRYDREKIVLGISESATDYSGWGIRLLSVIGGILACAFLLGFLLLADIWESAAAMTVIGFLFTAGSVFLNRVVSHTALEAASIAAYIAGFALIAFGMGSLEAGSAPIIFTCMALALATLLVTESFLLLFFPVLIVNGCIVALTWVYHAYDLIHLPVLITAGMYTWLSLSEPELLASGTRMRMRFPAIRAGFLFSFLGMLILIGQRTDLLPQAFHFRWWISSAVILGALILVIQQVIRSAGVIDSRSQMLIYGLGLLVLLPAFFAPAVMGCLLILVLGFHTSQPAAKVIGVVGLLWSVSRYYYDLNYSLLVKSELMMASGLLYLLAFFILQKQRETHDQQL